MLGSIGSPPSFGESGTAREKGSAVAWEGQGLFRFIFFFSSFVPGEHLRFCPKDRDHELEEYRLRAVERNFDLGRDIGRERELEPEASESMDRDLLRPRFASR